MWQTGGRIVSTVGSAFSREQQVPPRASRVTGLYVPDGVTGDGNV